MVWLPSCPFTYTLAVALQLTITANYKYRHGLTWACSMSEVLFWTSACARRCASSAVSSSRCAALCAALLASNFCTTCKAFTQGDWTVDIASTQRAHHVWIPGSTDWLGRANCTSLSKGTFAVTLRTMISPDLYMRRGVCYSLASGRLPQSAALLSHPRTQPLRTAAAAPAPACTHAPAQGTVTIRSIHMTCTVF